MYAMYGTCAMFSTILYLKLRDVTESSRVKVQVVFIKLYLKHFRPVACPEPVKLQIVCVGFKEYEKHCYDLSQLRLTCKYGDWAGVKSIPLLIPVGSSYVHWRCLVRKEGLAIFFA